MLCASLACIETHLSLIIDGVHLESQSVCLMLSKHCMIQGNPQKSKLLERQSHCKEIRAEDAAC